ncbi:G patch domain-containing protein 1 homolog [Drosophila guanche]|uniref:Blast:G patch domain-containing protein 1 homolog n=2 Tax=Drosophila guanche TaxID=7266 RepID=A0A3B0JM12_DROGU|nr:G patch domain-containing protein 1 homolog [Drosophila guanche]SPP76460.1 blast:G patch domain-containing protein 1 homolog [Drosophila guanche]
MDDEESLHRFGTPLPTLEKDVVPAKKPLAIEDQIVKDENGKRRFHGAFTGGFSAGFWNTVGSLEGWTPQTFKSSRAEKATPRMQQRPEDFMDKEDLGEFGIAPQGIRTREEFSKESEEEQRTGQRKRKLMQPEQVGPIPGVPVLEHLLRPVRDKVAMRILKSMGWKPGQGVGPRQTKKEKRQASARNKREQYLLEHYGAEGLSSLEQQQVAAAEEGRADDNDDDEEDEDITFAPDDYEPIFYTPKENRFGMSYSGLSRDPILSKSSTAHPAAPMQHINLFGQLETQPKQKPLSIRGQAFGVGAFEEEDDDIYARDDMTRYDFSLADKKPKQKKIQHVQQRNVIDGFSEDKSGAALQKPYAIDLPRDFKPRNWLQRRTRFEPMDRERTKKLEARNEYKRTGLGRHDLNPEQRAQLLGEQKSQKKDQQPEQPPSRNPFKERNKLLDLINAKSEGFTKGGLIVDEVLPQAEAAAETQTTATAMAKQVKDANATIQEKAVRKTKDLASATPSAGFKPFLADEAKQLRYDKFLEAQLKTDAEITEFLANMQPVTLSLWDREMEKKEFIQAAKIYRPLNGLMYDRFVSEATVQAEQIKEQQKPPEERKVVMERTKAMWKPASLLCKRYNIAEPFGGSMLEPPKELKGRPKISIFDYLETSINSKADFQTPSIRPKHMEKPKPAVLVPPPLAPLPPPDAVVPEPEKEKKVEEPTTVKPSFVPRTPLEQAVDESREKPISEKKDLFRSIFEDSDEEDPVPVAAPAITSLSTPQEQLAAINEALGLPSTSGVSASSLNVLRNNSPPRGIFAALFKPIEELKPKEATAPPKFAPIEGNKLKIAYKSREERLRNDKELAMAEVPVEDIYGPKLPEKGAAAKTHAPEADHVEVGIEAKLQHLWQKHAPKKRSAEKWVEKKALSTDDSDSDSSSDTSSSCSTSSPAKAKRTKVSKSKKSSHRSASSKKSKKSEKKSKKKSKSKSKKSSDRSKPKAKKKKSKH